LKTKDIHLSYAGGSGGFICTHTILQSQQHFSVFKEIKPPVTKEEFLEQFDQIKKRQWHITDNLQWKTTEVWPDNKSTSQHHVAGLNRLYMTCNSFSFNNVQLEQSSINVIIFTDIESQIELSQYKNCGLFYNNKQNLKDFISPIINHAWQISYNQVKDIAWPTIQLCDIGMLPKNIQQELLTLDQGFDIFFDYDQHKNYYLIYKQIATRHMSATYKINDTEINVDARIFNFFSTGDHIVKLQDVIRSKGRYLTDLLELPWNTGHADLIDNWVKLHPPELIEQILSR